VLLRLWPLCTVRFVCTENYFPIISITDRHPWAQVNCLRGPVVQISVFQTVFPGTMGVSAREFRWQQNFPFWHSRTAWSRARMQPVSHWNVCAVTISDRLWRRLYTVLVGSTASEHSTWHYTDKKALNQKNLTYVLALHGAVFRRVRKISKSDHKLPHVCLSVRVEQLGSHSSDFHEIWYFSIFRKYVEELQVWLKSDKNTRMMGTVREHPITFRWFLLKTRNVSERNVEKIKKKNTFCFRQLFL